MRLKLTTAVLCLAAAMALSPAPALAGPRVDMPINRVVVEKPLLQGDPIRAEFTITNQGDADLVIESVKPG